MRHTGREVLEPSEEAVTAGVEIDHAKGRPRARIAADVDDATPSGSEGRQSDAVDELPRGGRSRERQKQQGRVPVHRLVEEARSVPHLVSQKATAGSRHLFRLPTRRSHTPDIPRTVLMAREINPPAVARPPGDRLRTRSSRDLAWRAAFGVDGPDVTLTTNVPTVEGDGAAIWRPRGCAWPLPRVVGELARGRPVRCGHPDCDVPGANRAERQSPTIWGKAGVGFKRRGRGDLLGWETWVEAIEVPVPTEL